MSVNFSNATLFPVGQNPNSVAVVDVDGDGNLDIVTGGSSPIAGSTFATGSVSTLLGDGKGGFKPAITSSGTQFGSAKSIAIGDFNNDTRPDVITTGNLFGITANDVFVAIGDARGNFTATTSLLVGNDPQSVVVGDINKDGNLDAVTANTGGNTATILLGDGAGKFKTPTNITLPGTAESVALQDLSGDGQLDLLALTSVSNTDSGFDTQLSLLLGDGKGGFTASPAIDLQSPDPFNSDLAIADFNQDGQADVAALVGNKISILTADGSAERFRLVFQTDQVSNSLTVGDFNGDGRSDLLTDAAFGAAVLLGNGAGGFSRPIAFTAFNQSGTSAKAVGDFNKDGKTDLATTSSSFKETAVLLNSTAVNDGLTQGVDSSGVAYIDASSELGAAIKVDLQKGTLLITAPVRLTQSAKGIDDVIGTVQDDKISGSNRDNFLNGFAGNDELIGGKGDDRLIGGAGKDEITTGEGKDRCIFTATSNYPEGLETAYNKLLLGVDRITDFDLQRDKIVLDTGTFTAITTKKVRFAQVDDLSEAKLSKGIITYVADSGKLYYNANGAKDGFGGGGAFAVLENQVALTAKNFAAFE